MQLKGIKFKYIMAVAGVLALALGVYFTFFATADYKPVTTTVVSVEREDAGEDTYYTVIVKYTVNGKQYQEEISVNNAEKLKSGDTVEALYKPSDPAVVKTKSTGAGIYMIVVGGLLVAGFVFMTAKEKSGKKENEQLYPGGFKYAPSVKGESRELYFITDTGTAKYGHRIEDKNRTVLFEAKVTKFTMLSATRMDFIDHVHNKTMPHLIGHEESAERSGFLIDNYSTFSFDGEDIWDHLKRNGVKVESSFMEGKTLWPQYRVYRDGEEIALIQASNYRVHEEDQTEGKLANAVPARGFYRIFTGEQNLDLLFTVALAFARTEANDDRGGNYGLLFGKKKK